MLGKCVTSTFAEHDRTDLPYCKEVYVQVWQAPAVPLPGIPEEEGWPTAEQVVWKHLCHCYMLIMWDSCNDAHLLCLTDMLYATSRKRCPCSWVDECSIWMQVGCLLKSKPLAPVSTYDIEQDCLRLLSTGLFQSVRPKLNRPGTVPSCW